MKVPISKIKRSPFESRDTYGQEDFEELKQQAKAGLIYPLLVRPLDGEYEVVDGHRRLAALKAIGAKEVPVAVYEADDYELASIAVDIGTRTHSEVEKGEMVWKWLERQFLITSDEKKPKDPAAFLATYRLEGSWTEFNKRMGDPLGKLKQRFGSLVSVEQWLRAYREIAPPVREMLSRGEITSSQARHVAEGLPGRPELQEKAAKKIAREGIGRSQAVGELTKVLRAAPDEKTQEAILKTRWVKPMEQIEQEAQIEIVVEELETKEREERKRAWWEEHPSTKEAWKYLKMYRSLLDDVLESVEREKIPPEHCNFLAEFLDTEMIPYLQGVVARLREKAKRWQ